MALKQQCQNREREIYINICRLAHEPGSCWVSHNDRVPVQ